MERVSIIVVLGLGGVLINTIPVWVGELAQHPRLSDSTAGTMASAVLLAAAVTCAGFGSKVLAPNLAKIVLFTCLVLLALHQALPAIVVALSCFGLGGAMGALSRRALSNCAASTLFLPVISIALSLGLIVSLFVYLAVSLLGVPSLWILASLSIAILGLRFGPAQGAASFDMAAHLSATPVRYLAFFVTMGAYWTFLEVFGSKLGSSDVLAFWLLGSLITGTIGSALASRVPFDRGGWLKSWALVAAAVTGAASYVSPDMNTLGISILLNAVFLFLFIPLYLTEAGDRAPIAMATYLLGFAFGGVVGALIIAMGGFLGLAGAILLSALLAVLPSKHMAQR